MRIHICTRTHTHTRTLYVHTQNNQSGGLLIVSMQICSHKSHHFGSHLYVIITHTDFCLRPSDNPVHYRPMSHAVLRPSITPHGLGSVTQDRGHLQRHAASKLELGRGSQCFAHCKSSDTDGCRRTSSLFCSGSGRDRDGSTLAPLQPVLGYHFRRVRKVLCAYVSWLSL